MFFNSLLLILYFHLILLSLLGYGVLFCKFCKINLKEIGIGILGLLSIFFLTFISYLTNFFFSHNTDHNLAIFIIGLLLFLIFLVKDEILIKKEIVKVLAVSYLLIIALFMSKNNEDFGYYHFAYIVNLTENKVQFGLANFNSGFGTQSSIFYFTSLLHLPIIKYYLFNLHSLLILIFSNLFFLENFCTNKKKNNFIKILSFLAFTFVNLVFWRLAEYGTDRSGQIIVFIIIITYLSNSIKNLFFQNNIKILLILITYIITIKSFFLIYILLFPLIVIQIKNKILNFFFKNKNLLLILFLYLLLFFSVNIANTGCIIYPLSLTCFPNLFWSVPLDTVIDLNHWFELWSKSGAGPNYAIEDRIGYINNFNWVSNWIKNYFFTKVSDTLLALFLICIVFIFLLKSNQIYKKKILPKVSYLYFFLILLILIWFNKHPDLRYGGYVLIALFFFIPLTSYLCKYKFNSNFNNLKVFCIVTIIFLSFNIRNGLRILSEFNRNDVYKFYNFPFFSKEYLKTNINFNLISEPQKIMGYNFYSRR